MSIQDLSHYRARWDAVKVYLREERRSASLELRWQQLNAAYGMGKALGWLRPDPSEIGVFQRWAKLKEQAANQRMEA